MSTAKTDIAPGLASQAIAVRTELPGPRAKEMIARVQPFYSPSLIHCYPLMVKRAAGLMVEDVDGNVFMDMQAGVAACSTGHCHPKVAQAVAEQANVLMHICGTDFHYPGYGLLSERLAQLMPGDNDWGTFLTNSGTEGVEAAIKLVRNHTGRSQMIAFRGAFHGRSLGSLSLTASKPKYRKGFGPLTPGTHHVDYGDADAIVNDLFAHTVPAQEVAAIFVEPVQGEGGYIVPKPEFLRKLREICDREGILLVADEVQSGMGRTGKMLAIEHFGVVPDVVVLAKGLASGFPLGAMVARKKFMTWGAGSHGSTCGGNPVCIAAAMATIDLLENGLVANSAKVGAHLKERLAKGLASNKAITEVRGLGLMIGVEFATHELADRVAQLLYRRGMLVLECGTKGIRMSPPLIVTQEQADLGADLFIAAVSDVAAGKA
jgi:4-aminobutyrate aminotransferase